MPKTYWWARTQTKISLCTKLTTKRAVRWRICVRWRSARRSSVLSCERMKRRPRSWTTGWTTGQMASTRCAVSAGAPPSTKGMTCCGVPGADWLRMLGAWPRTPKNLSARSARLGTELIRRLESLCRARGRRDTSKKSTPARSATPRRACSCALFLMSGSRRTQICLTIF